jgi:hypothetical protein
MSQGLQHHATGTKNTLKNYAIPSVPPVSNPIASSSSSSPLPFPSPSQPPSSCVHNVLYSATVTVPSESLIRLPSRICQHPATTLIDCGSSSNFISESFIKQHNIKTQNIPTTQCHEVELADGTKHQCHRIVKRARLELSSCNHSSFNDLVVLPLSGYDCILGMAFLKEYQPQIDFVNKQLSFNTTNTSSSAVQDQTVKPSETIIYPETFESLQTLHATCNEKKKNEEEHIDEKEARKKLKLKLNLISCMEMKRERRKRGNMIYLCMVRPSLTNQEEMTNKKETKEVELDGPSWILKLYKDVFPADYQ